MKVYVFGNQDSRSDSKALELVERLSQDIERLQFVEVKPNEDVPFVDEKLVVIMDLVEGIDEARIIEGRALDKLVMSPRSSVHDFDLGFQLKYLKKLGKLGEVKIVGLPMSGKIDYDSIHSIFRKLVAQDIQGS